MKTNTTPDYEHESYLNAWYSETFDPYDLFESFIYLIDRITVQELWSYIYSNSVGSMLLKYDSEAFYVNQEAHI